MKTVKSLLIALVEFFACVLFSLVFTMAVGHVSFNDLSNMLYPQTPTERTLIEAVSIASDIFLSDYDDCSNDLVCTLATGFNPSDSYMTPILISLGYSREQSEYVLTLVVETFDLYQG